MGLGWNKACDREQVVFRTDWEAKLKVVVVPKKERRCQVNSGYL
jgi:hypothetical protein